MLFRTQKIAVTDDGAVMAADEATVELFADDGGFGSLGELLSQNRTPLRTVDLDVLDAEQRARRTGTRDERHDLSVSLNRGRPALDGAVRACWRMDRAFPRRERVRSARARDRRRALDVARRSRRRGERAAERPLQPVDVDEARMRTAAVPVPARFRQSGRHAARARRTPRLARDGDG